MQQLEHQIERLTKELLGRDQHAHELDREIRYLIDECDRLRKENDDNIKCHWNEINDFKKRIT